MDNNKQYDMMSLVLKNPDATLSDIASSGLDTNDIGLKSEDYYTSLKDVNSSLGIVIFIATNIVNN